MRKKDALTTLQLRDGSFFILPRVFLSRIGVTIDDGTTIDTDASSMRHYANLLNNLGDQLCLSSEDEAASQVVRKPRTLSDILKTCKNSLGYKCKVCDVWDGS